MTYKATMVYVVMRRRDDGVEFDPDPIPVAVFTDLEVAEGNVEGYNLSMEENGISEIRFYLRTTMLYE